MPVVTRGGAKALVAATTGACNRDSDLDPSHENDECEDDECTSRESDDESECTSRESDDESECTSRESDDESECTSRESDDESECTSRESDDESDESDASDTDSGTSVTTDQSSNCEGHTSSSSTGSNRSRSSTSSSPFVASSSPSTPPVSSLPSLPSLPSLSSSSSVKLERGVGPRGLVARASTLRHEISKYLGRVPSDHVSEDLDLRAILLFLDGTCEYCRVNKATTHDHFWPMVVDRRPSGFCSDTWNIVPACQSCNGSKGNRKATVWMRSDAGGNPLRRMTDAARTATLTRFDLYSETSFAQCRRVRVDMEKYHVIDTRIDELLLELADSVRDLDLDLRVASA